MAFLLTVAGVLTVRVVAAIARRSMKATSTHSRSQRGRPPSRLTTVLGVVGGLPALGFLAVICLHGLAHPSTAWATDRFAALIAAAVICGVASVLMGVPGFIAALGPEIANRVPASCALGLRGAAFEFRQAEGWSRLWRAR